MGTSPFVLLSTHFIIMKNYADNRMHYRMLISKINQEVDFSGYLHVKGYALLKSSVGSKEYGKDQERIVLNTKRNPVSYFNRNDTQDKGWFFSYILHRSTNFYTAITLGLEAINASHYSEAKTNHVLHAKKSTNLEAKFLIEPLKRWNYIIKERGLSLKTLESEAFKNKVLNGIYDSTKGNQITNIALPLTDTEGNIKNYILFNKPYWSPKKNKLEKFRRVMNSEYHFLFASNPTANIKAIACFESGFDAMAFHESKGFPNLFYLAFNGQLDERKLEQFFLWKNKIDPNGKLPIKLGFDHDIAGFYFDMYFLKSLMDREKKQNDFVLHRQNSEVKLQIRGREITKFGEELKTGLTNINQQIGQQPAKVISLKETLIIEIQLENILLLGHGKYGSRWYWDGFFSVLTSALEGPKIQIQKPPLHKDWNDDLIWFKTHEQLMDVSSISKGIDKSLWAVHVSKPQGNYSPIGKVMMVGEQKVLCDIGEIAYRWISKEEITAFFRKKKTLVTHQENIKSASHGRKK
tara:strand:+ start:960 stop:2522 length:1563 start_codon:yes stop_codon:yes gene_type:complete